MKRVVTLLPPVLIAIVLFGGLVYLVLVAAQVSTPSATTVYGMTLPRFWATTTAVLALIGVIIGGWAVARPAKHFGTNERFGAIATVVIGLLAIVNGWAVVTISNGGPGTGNGVVGGAIAFVLGLFAIILGGWALRRPRALG